MKRRFVLLLMIVLLLVGGTLFSATIASVNQDSCEAGDHVYEYVDSDLSWYGGTEEFTVSSCPIASYAHTHFYITYMERRHFSCQFCGHQKTVEIMSRDMEQGECCKLNRGRR